MKVKINTRLECAPAAEGKTLVVKRSARTMMQFQTATGWKLEQIGIEVQRADILAVPMAVFFALANAGFTPDWEELLDTDPQVAFESIPEPGDDRAAAQADPPQLPADSSPAADGDGQVQPGKR